MNFVQKCQKRQICVENINLDLWQLLGHISPSISLVVHPMMNPVSLFDMCLFKIYRMRLVNDLAILLGRKMN